MHPEITSSPTDDVAELDGAVIVTSEQAGEGFVFDGHGSKLDELLGGELTAYLQRTNFKAEPGRVTVVPTLGRAAPAAIAVAGIGTQPAPAAYRRAAGAAARKVSDHADVTLVAPSDPAAAQAMIEGALLATYRFTGYRTSKPSATTARFRVLGTGEAVRERGAAYGRAVAAARDLTNEPGDVLTPVEFARRAEEMARSAGLDVEVLDEDGIAERGMNGVLAVAKGSEQPPRVVHLSRNVDTAGKVALVGKGVTFDSGGLSLKDVRGIETMKTDMAGAAAVIAAACAVAELGAPVSFDAYAPMVENLPSGSSLKPGDVIHHYGGTTSEVLNTDAEGRLILGDVLAWASEEQPEALVDVATLTGTMHVALGRSITGFFATDDGLADELLSAARVAGEDFWRMPLYEPYRSDIESDVADMKNAGSRYGGAILAALFLHRFVKEGIPWAHLDIAGPARSDGATDDGPKGATGVATRTLIAWLEDRAR